jgi:hypothetical protein
VKNDLSGRSKTRHQEQPSSKTRPAATEHGKMKFERKNRWGLNQLGKNLDLRADSMNKNPLAEPKKKWFRSWDTKSKEGKINSTHEIKKPVFPLKSK